MSKRKKPSYLPVLVSTTLVLFLLGLLGLVLINAEKLTSYLKENVMLTVYFNVSASDEEVSSKADSIAENSYVRRSEFVSKEEAAVIMREEIEEDFVETLGFNPLPSKLYVYLKSEYTNKEAIRDIMDDLALTETVAEVNYQEDQIDAINRYRSIIGYVLAGLAVILLFISILLVNNTIRLSVYANRFLIKSMQLVGATEWFILRPYIGRSVLIAMFGTILAICLTIGTYMVMATQASSFLPLNVTAPNDLTWLLQDISYYSLLFVALLVTGLAITMISTWVSTKHYLRLKIDDLY